jgi:PQQ-like domain
MKKSILLLLLFIACISMGVNGQPVKPLWSKTVPEGIKWQKVTSLGNYIVGTSQGLAGIDPEKGEILWKNSKFGILTPDMVTQLGSSALLTISSGTSVAILDAFSGEIKFDARDAGISEIRDQKILYKANGILVSGRNAQGKDILLMSSMIDGKVKWKIEDDFGRFITASEVSQNELLIVTIFFNYKVNPADGKVIWKNDVSEANKQIEKLGALGGLVKQAAANKAQTMDFNVKFYQHPTKPLFYIASEQEGKPAATVGFTSTTTTGSGPSYHTTYSAFDITNGNRIWAKPLDLSGKIGGVYFDEGGIIIMPNDGSNTKVNSYDYQTQVGKWGKKGKGIDVKGGIYAYEKVKDGLVLISQNASGKNFASYLDQTKALLTFDKPVQIEGTLVTSELTPKGLFYITTQEVNVLDITLGKRLLDKGISTMPSLTAQKDNIVYVYNLNDNTLVALDKTTASLKVVTSGIKFEGKESPQKIELRDNGILVSSSQNLALVGFDGKIAYQKYFEAPREPGIIRALQYAQSVRAAYIGAAAYSVSASFQSAGQQAKANNEQSGGVLLENIGSAYGELGNAASDFAKKSWQAASARFKATQNADNYTVVLTKQDKNNVLMKINKVTGASEGTIDLGKDIAPNYTMDGVTGTVYYSSGTDAVVAYKF